jgi:IS605 OrfB family transposase
MAVRVKAAERAASGLRALAAPFQVPSPSGVAIRTRLHPSPAEEDALREIGAHLGSLATADLAARCRDGADHDSAAWARRKQGLTADSSSRWAGSICRASNEQWALSRRNQTRHITDLQAGIATVAARLALPVGSKGTRKTLGGYRSAEEWFTKSRRLGILTDRLAKAEADRLAGRVRVVRGGKKLANARHHLDDAGLTVGQWQDRWMDARIFLSADGEAGRPYGNDTIRVAADGLVSVNVPALLSRLSNAPHGRLTLTAPVTFAHRAEAWAAQVAAKRAVAYTISHDARKDRWYLTASWRLEPAPPVPAEAALAPRCVGVDFNADHLAARQLDAHGNPVGPPGRFRYVLAGTTERRDAQIRHAISALLQWTEDQGIKTIAIEDLDFAGSKTREQFGRRKAFRRLIAGFPTAVLRDRLAAMAAEAGVAVIAVDPAYTTRWGKEHWLKAMPPRHQTTGHDAAAIVIGRRAQGFSARRRTPPPPHDRRDRAGHRSAQAGPGNPGHEETRPPRTGPAARRLSPPGIGTRETSSSKTVRDERNERGLPPARCLRKGTVGV